MNEVDKELWRYVMTAMAWFVKPGIQSYNELKRKLEQEGNDTEHLEEKRIEWTMNQKIKHIHLILNASVRSRNVIDRILLTEEEEGTKRMSIMLLIETVRTIEGNSR